jgi:glycosyltransferase involved in cell wall biosynthesis
VLSVGRLAAHKRPDLVVRAFALYQRHHEPSARLLCAGPPLDPESTARLEALARDVGARNVSFAGALSQPRLNGAYAEARVFLSMSEHEGFCIPLLEALHFGVASVARPSGGMPEVGGDAVLWDEDTDLATTAELIQLAATDEKLRAELTRRAAARVEALAPERVAESLRSAVDELLELQPGRAILTA